MSALDFREALRGTRAQNNSCMSSPQFTITSCDGKWMSKSKLKEVRTVRLVLCKRCIPMSGNAYFAQAVVP